MGQPKKVADIDMKVVAGLLERLRTRQLGPEDYALLERVVQRLLWLSGLVREGRTKLARLQRLLGFSKSEKTAAVLGPQGAKGDSTGDGNGPEDPPDPGGAGGGAPGPEAGAAPGGTGGSAEDTGKKPQTEGRTKPKVKGHGRRPVSAYRAAQHFEVPHESLRPGQTCPACGQGTLFELEPAHFLRIFGQAPLCALCWDCQRLRCSACGLIHTARAPHEAQGDKYDESAASMMAALRYGCGMPHHRLEQLQADLHTPVPASTQWEVVEAAVSALEPVHGELVRQAAQGSLLHLDDSHGPILEWMGKRRAALLEEGKLEDPERTGLFTTGVVAITGQGRKIALFFTGRKHAGENLGALLDKRGADLPPPIHMSDALACNNPVGHAVIGCNCLAHGRRNIVDEVLNFPDETRYLLEQIGRVFKIDQICRELKLSDEERLARHQRESAPVMMQLEAWMKAQFEEKRVEPNSGLGAAINYLLKRWDRFTLFLRLPGVPLDNNVCERALKMAIRHRRNSLFYRTQHGAEVGDLYMALIHTTQLYGENPVDYLTALQIHARVVAETPADWMPWNWRDTLSRRAARAATASEARAA